MSANPAQHVFEPLCDATAELVKPLALWPNDRLDISIDRRHSNFFIIQSYATLNGERRPASRIASYEFFARLQERSELGYGRWKVAATDFNVMLINALWEQDRLTFLDDLAKTTYTFLLLRFVDQTRHAVSMAKFKEEGIVPEPPVQWYDHWEFPLAEYQRTAAYVASQSEGFAFFMEQGTGKTPTSIAVLMHKAKEHFKRTGEMFRCIIVCPKNVKENWQREIHKFAIVPGKVVVLRGGKLHRMKQLVDVSNQEEGCQFAVAICSYDSVERTWEGIGLFNWNLGIADESDMFKSPWAKRSKTMMKLRDKCDQRLALTGTPVNNSILDLYYQLEWLGEGMSGFNEWKQFKSYYNKYADPGEFDKNYQGAKVLIGFQNLPMLHERLARVSFRITKKEAMPSLPDKMYDIVECSMGKDQKRIYKMIATQLAAELQDALNDQPTAMTVSNVLTKLLRLSQITSGYAVSDRRYDDEGVEITKDSDRLKWFETIPKLDELMDILSKKTPDEKTIVWTCWVPTIKKISEALTAAGIKHVTYFGGTSDKERAAAEQAFNCDPEVKVFIGNPAAGGVGMNLPGYDASNEDAYTTNADHTIYYACNWSFRQRAQSEDRNHGRGRCRGPVRYTDLIVPGSIDHEIMSKLQDKKATALEAQDVKQIMRRLLSFNPTDMED